jgi:putative hydrolase of the HAD superfamily
MTNLQKESAQAKTVWLFDLDNTLHNASAKIFPRVNVAMTEFVARKLNLSLDAANEVRQKFWQQYGATLLGLVKHHGIDMAEFLAQAHPFPDMANIVERNNALVSMLRRLPGRKVLLTNAPRAYAKDVLDAIGIRNLFERVIAIEDMRFGGALQPKPDRRMMRRLAATLKVAPQQCVLVEDSIENIRAARAVRMRSVLVLGFSFSHRVNPTRRQVRPRNRVHSPDHQLQSAQQLIRLSRLQIPQ